MGWTVVLPMDWPLKTLKMCKKVFDIASNMSLLNTSDLALAAQSVSKNVWIYLQTGLTWGWTLICVYLHHIWAVSGYYGIELCFSTAGNTEASLKRKLLSDISCMHFLYGILCNIPWLRSQTRDIVFFVKMSRYKPLKQTNKSRQKVLTCLFLECSRVVHTKAIIHFAFGE